MVSQSSGIDIAEANSVMVQLMRLSRGWPMKRLAELAGVHASHVTRVEAGRLSLAGKPLRDYAQALSCRPELLCVPYRRTPAEGNNFRANASAAEWKRDRVLANANIAAMRIGRIVENIDLDPAISLPTLEPDDYAAEFGEITVAQVLRRYWRLSGPITDLTGLLESAGVFVVAELFTDKDVDAVSLRSNEFHPHVIYINRALPADRFRLTLAHELGHLVMDAMTLAHPKEVERRATSFAAEFLAPYPDIEHDLARVSPRTAHELDELRMRWGVSAPSFIVRAHDRGHLSDYHYRTMFRILNETGRVYGDRPGVDREEPRLVGHILDELTEAGFKESDLDAITLLTNDERTEMFGTARRPTREPTPRKLSLV
ncbi:ImmA/IrrE family metallo-endopeptidase [Mycolicibacterium sp. P9-64]|uniref:ImmA/IrrE family metallo-endopeptidase n=1 Tax=Mycolicibacterium sp. P9-64 TaxID=2024612 RepID=UPI0011F06945|nr:XRE family transcriptional regulator [Mycolicibacterium sp. P9-64]KAA0085572.1 ImmA/IrrE family metallo-endopeptidase [Mycolicibacterium sp. P9-64]